MGVIKGKVEASITLSKATCYFMLTGKCSLNIVSDYYITASTRTAANDLLYCPRLYKAMCNREKMKPIAITPCDCGHAEVISGHQRACIASQKHLELTVKPAGPEQKENCPVCDGQIKFEENSGCNRLMNLNISVIDE